MGQRYEVPNSFFLQNLRLGHKLTGEQEKRSPSSYNAYLRGPGLRWHEICSYCSWISLLSGRNGHCIVFACYSFQVDEKPSVLSSCQRSPGPASCKEDERFGRLPLISLCRVSPVVLDYADSWFAYSL